MALPTILLLSILSLILLPSPSSANEGNILATGDVLPTDGQLSYKDAAFVIQGDCNLVLYGPKFFQSNTHGRGTDCTLTLSDYGQLIVKSSDGSYVWTSPGRNKKGRYVAILDPDGEVKVYGPSIWSTPANYLSSAIIDAELNSSASPLVRNVLFSLDILEEKGKLTSRDYSLDLTDECNLKFTKGSRVVWQSNTRKDNGHVCFARLNNYGRLAVVEYKKQNQTVLWLSEPKGAKGVYALVVEVQGQATIYGPVIWSTSGNRWALTSSKKTGVLWE